MSKKVPGEIPLTLEQEVSDNWFWVAMREGNAHARALQDMTPAERQKDYIRLLGNN